MLIAKLAQGTHGSRGSDAYATLTLIGSTRIAAVKDPIARLTASRSPNGT